MANLKRFKFQVAPGCSVLDMKGTGENGRLLRTGQVLDNDHFSEEWLEDAMKNRQVLMMTVAEPVLVNPDPSAPQPGVEPGPAIGGDLSSMMKNAPAEPPIRIASAGTAGHDRQSGQDSGGITRTTAPIDPERVPALGDPISQRSTIWDMDPEKLKDKSLEALNVLILDRDPKMGVMNTIAEAIAVLSMDFKKPETTAPVTTPSTPARTKAVKN